MKSRLVFGLFLSVSAIFVDSVKSVNDVELEARKFLQEYDKQAALLLNEMTIANWNYETNITDETAEISSQAGLKYSAFKEEAFINATKFNLSLIQDPSILRQFKFVIDRPLNATDEEELNSLISDMGSIYGSAKVCFNESACFNLEPDLANIMAESKNYKEREFVWKEWRRVVGQEIKPLYTRYVELKNMRARLNGYDDYGHEWRAKYETNRTFEEDVMRLYKELEPLYKELHAYVRRKLSKIYGEDVIDLKGKLPANVLSDMWGRFWNNLYKELVPYPEKPNLDPSEEMAKQNYTVIKMFQTGDKFYKDMGLFGVPDSFWELSMFEKPVDRKVICHATAWDFYDKKDYRIRMCTRPNNFEDLNTIHHELGHIQYDQHYKDQPVVFRDGANDGFHEAIGELMAMSGATPKHLFSLGLIPTDEEDYEQDINFLMSQSLITISTLPFHLVNDLWRWRAFRGEYQEEEWNNEFWKLKESIVGVKAPVERTKDDLDPPTIFHVCQDFDMIRYFIRTILQFQFAEKLCEVAGHTGPLHRCDFSGSKEAGKVLGEMLKLGSSQPWQEALYQLTGTRDMSAKPILEFFGPLYDWLREKNAENGDKPGWDDEQSSQTRNYATSFFVILSVFTSILNSFKN